jgi:hypothetical protein
MPRVLFIGIVMLTATAVLSGCFATKHPLIQALSPRNLPRTLFQGSELEARLNAHGKVPLLPPGSVTVESDGMVTIITVRSPVDPKALADLVRRERQGGKQVRVVREDEKAKGGRQ